MANAQDLIESALENIGVKDPGEALSAEDAQTGLTTLNRMLDIWSAQRLMVPFSVTESFPLEVGTVSYTIGDGATWDTVRPNDIEDAYIRDSSGEDYRLKIIRDRRNYDRIKDKDQSSRPNRLWYDTQYALGVVFLDSAPALAETIFLISKKLLAKFANLTAEASFPPGYEAAIEYNLAVWLAPKFSTKVSAEVAVLAENTMRVIKSFNWQPMESDLGLPDGTRSLFGYDIATGEYYR